MRTPPSSFYSYSTIYSPLVCPLVIYIMGLDGQEREILLAASWNEDTEKEMSDFISWDSGYYSMN